MKKLTFTEEMRRQSLIERGISVIFTTAIACIVAGVAFIGISCSADAKSGHTDNVPGTVQQFVAANFPSAQIVKVEKDHKLLGVEYEVKLSNGVEIDFDTNNEWETIDCEKTGVSVPATVIPKNIAKYVATNYPTQSVVEIEKKSYGYEAQLSNRIELIFDAAGQFLHIDN